MSRFILTGAPGAGKTTIVNRLSDLGYKTIQEGFMDLHKRMQADGWADPLQDHSFIERLVLLQAERLHAIPQSLEEEVFLDRSPLCTLALSRLMERSPPEALLRAVDEMVTNNTYARRVFLVEHLGQVVDDGIRTLDLEQTLEFEMLHREVYEEHGYTCVDIPPLPVDERMLFFLDRFQDTLLHASSAHTS